MDKISVNLNVEWDNMGLQVNVSNVPQIAAYAWIVRYVKITTVVALIYHVKKMNTTPISTV